MSTTHIHPTERRLLGWYAIRWAHLTDWLRGNLHNISRTSAASQTGTLPQAFPDTKEKGKDNDEETPESEAEKLRHAVKDTNRILYKAHSVFPFMLFPDVITVDRQKLTIVYKRFFTVFQTVSVPLDQIKNIEANLGPFFGSLTITSDLFINNVRSINLLTRKDAYTIQKMVQGATTAINQKIDFSKIQTKQLKKLLCELGEGHAHTFDT